MNASGLARAATLALLVRSGGAARGQHLGRPQQAQYGRPSPQNGYSYSSEASKYIVGVGAPICTFMFVHAVIHLIYARREYDRHPSMTRVRARVTNAEGDTVYRRIQSPHRRHCDNPHARCSAASPNLPSTPRARYPDYGTHRCEVGGCAAAQARAVTRRVRGYSWGRVYRRREARTRAPMHTGARTRWAMGRDWME
ncbi:hypothetical protein OH77DRAFT_66374 [Trametes cingulata]|nr:hypothetical protein OH77DRAFT_66374 [Trametes cingulata]